MIIDWDAPNPFWLTTPFDGAPLPLNQMIGNGDYYVLRRDGCSVDRPLRVTVDQIPQGDGSILHRRFTEGYQVTLKVDMWHSESANTTDALPACDEDLQRMTDRLMGHLNAMLNADDARLEWTPPGYASRLFTNMRWRSFPQQDPEDPGESVVFVIDTEFPYAISALQTTPAFGAPFTNAGNADFYPVLHVDGPSSAFLVTNGSEGIVYDSSRPGAIALGGGDYAEIDCFRNTIVLNGNVQDLDAGVDPNLSSFFSLPPGTNTVTMSGAAGGYVLMNDAFA